MLNWLKRLFSKQVPGMPVPEPALPAGRPTIRLDVTRDYVAPADGAVGTPDESSVYRLAHRQGWMTFAAESYTYIAEDGRPSGQVLGRGTCKRPFGSDAESAGFRAHIAAASDPQRQKWSFVTPSHGLC